MAAAVIRATRGRVTSEESAAAFASRSSRVLSGCRLGFFNGAFNPPTRAHAHIAAQVASRVDCLWLDPEPATAHKRRFMDESLDARIHSECTHLSQAANASAHPS